MALDVPVGTSQSPSPRGARSMTPTLTLPHAPARPLFAPAPSQVNVSNPNNPLPQKGPPPPVQCLGSAAAEKTAP